jgi:hypothetical protein
MRALSTRLDVEENLFSVRPSVILNEMRTGPLVALIALSMAACAHSSRKLYGDAARYSADDHAWVAENGSNRWVFRDPLTGCALQCRSDVQRWNRIAATRSHDVNKRDGAGLTAMLVTLPLTLPAVILILPAFPIAKALEPPSAQAYRSRADEARERGALDEAAESYLRAVASGDASAAEPLAQVWVEQGRTEDALRARRMLLCKSARLGEAQWNSLESWMRSQGGIIPECTDQSKEPVAIAWDD